MSLDVVCVEYCGVMVLGNEGDWSSNMSTRPRPGVVPVPPPPADFVFAGLGE